MGVKRKWSDIFLVICYTLMSVAGRKLDDEKPVFGGAVDVDRVIQLSPFVGRVLCTKTTIGHGGASATGTTEGGGGGPSGGEGQNFGNGGNEGNGEAGGGTSGGEGQNFGNGGNEGNAGGGTGGGEGQNGGSSGCFVGPGGLFSLCGKGIAFLGFILVLVCMGVFIWCGFFR